MVFISWNIDSLNAALTGDSPRALLSQAVLDTIKEHNPEVIAIQETKLSSNGPSKKHLEVLKDKFLDYEIVWNSSAKPAREGYAGTMFLYKDNLTPTVTLPVLEPQALWMLRGRIITLEFADFLLNTGLMRRMGMT